jgi:hypothetical protein
MHALTISKRLDPLVTLAGVSYYSQISGNVAGTPFDPENTIGTGLGACLTVTPTTSITTGANLSFVTNPNPNNLPVPNPDNVLSSAGAASSPFFECREPDLQAWRIAVEFSA